MWMRNDNYDTVILVIIAAWFLVVLATCAGLAGLLWKMVLA